MKYAFLNARLKSRRPDILTKEKLRSILLSRSFADVYKLLNKYNISEQDKSLFDVNLKLDLALNSYVHALSPMVRNSNFLSFFLKRYDLFFLLGNIQNNTQHVQSYSGQKLEGISRFALSTHEISDIERFFGFSINQDLHGKDLQDELVKQYYTKLVRLAETENEYLETVQLELYLVQKLYKFKVMDLPQRMLEPQKEAEILSGDLLATDLRLSSFMEKFTRRLAASDPLGGAVLVNFLYALEQHFKFVRLIFASVIKGINVDFRQLW